MSVYYYATVVPATLETEAGLSISRVLNVDRLAPLSKLTPNVMSQLLCFIEDDNSSHLIATLLQVLIPIVCSGCSSGKRTFKYIYCILKKTCGGGMCEMHMSGSMCVWRSEDRFVDSVLPFMFTWVLGI